MPENRKTEAGASIDSSRLFIGSCVALIATSVAFATVGAVMLSLKREFVLTNEEVGWIGGAALWGFAVSQLLFAPFADTIGMRFLLRMAFLGHLLGVLTMIIAEGFWTLFGGALVIAMANGLVEAACNPLVAALYPDNKTVKLNQFHVWFPGGAVLGGLAAYGLNQAGVTSWECQIGLVLIPTLIYGMLLLREPFPETEGVQAGVGMGEMFRAALATPFMWVMLIAMAMTASIELGPNRWVPAVVESGGMPGILVLVWISGLMALLRYKAGPVVHRFSPTGILVLSALVSGVGLFWLSYATGAMTFAAATVFAIGVCYFWPTMLGVVSERVPRSGALGLGLMGTVGMATVGVVTAPQMGKIADRYAHDQIPLEEAVYLFRKAETGLSGGAEDDVRSARLAASEVLDTFSINGTLPYPGTANALRALISSDANDEGLVAEAQGILGPADNHGGKISFRFMVPLSGILLLLFSFMYGQDRRLGGYRTQSIEGSA